MTVSRICCRRLALYGLLAAALVPASAAAQAPAGAAAPSPSPVDPFYSSRLREGVAAYERGAYLEAAASLRVACFGMLDAPAALAECLVRLGLAQAGGGDREGFAQTFRRVLEAEELLGLYSGAALPAELRAEFEKRAAEWIPAATLDDAPAFAHLGARPAPTGQRGRRGREEAPPPVAAAAPAPAATPAPPPPPPPPQSGDVAQAGDTLSAADARELARLRELLPTVTSTAEVEHVYAAAAELAARHPADRAVQHTAAEVAYRASRWRDAVAHFQRGGDPGEEQPLLLFYFAVSLWESGDRAAAAEAMARTEGRLRRTEFVESYRRKILPAAPAR